MSAARAVSEQCRHAASVAYRMVTERLLLRCWTPDDAPALHAAIMGSLGHLRAWMDWAAQEPQPPDQKVRFLRVQQLRFETGRSFSWGIFDAGQRSVLGSVGLHPRIGSGAAEIGYWIHVDHVRRGYGTEAAAAATRAAFVGLGVRRVEIHCDPRNLGSAGIPRRLGFQHQVTVPGRINHPQARPRDTMVWVLARDRYADSPAAGYAVRAFDRSDGPMAY